MRQLTGRDDVLALTGETTYVLAMTSATAPTFGYATDDALAWVSTGMWGRAGYVLGPPEQATELFERMRAEDAFEQAWHVHLPIGCDVKLEPIDVWQFRGLVGPPPPAPRAAEVVPIDDVGAIEKLLAEALPHTSTRPGDAGVRGWYGVRDRDGSLLACGADRSGNGVGHLAGIAVRPDSWGRGLGGAVTAAMTRRLSAEFERVSLGVSIDNPRAVALYERLGFTDSIERASYRM